MSNTDRYIQAWKRFCSDWKNNRPTVDAERTLQSAEHDLIREGGVRAILDARRRSGVDL